MKVIVGHNELEMCSSQLMLAVEHFMNTVMLKEEVQVLSIHERDGGGSYTFVVKFQPKSESKEP